MKKQIHCKKSQPCCSVKEIHRKNNWSWKKLYHQMIYKQIKALEKHTKKAERLLGFKAEVSLEEGVRRFVAWWEANKDSDECKANDSSH